jgi:amino acid transporter
MVDGCCFESLTLPLPLNCLSTRVTTQLQNVVMVTKLLALVLVIMGCCMAFYLGGKVTMVDNMWEGTATNPGQIAWCPPIQEFPATWWRGTSSNTWQRR